MNPIAAILGLSDESLDRMIRLFDDIRNQHPALDPKEALEQARAEVLED